MPPILNRRTVGLMLAALVLAGCASRPAAPELPKPVVKTVGLLPVAEPAEITLENLNAISLFSPITSVGFAQDSRVKNRQLVEKLTAQKLALGGELTAHLTQALEKSGYRVVLLTDVPRKPDDPDYIEYEKVKTDADAVLHVYYHRVGLYSGRFSIDYLPRVNIGATLYSTQRKEELYGEYLYYGVDAREGKDWAVVADPRYAWPSFDVVMEKSEEIGNVFKTGGRLLVDRLIPQLRASHN
ncbi:hypothetical protein [Piscinibacter koreensis]|uniref:Lipoprotein n=1 Tax=Piscinibacter koreensis TaxID=2742824 RepID=A0A7Y6NK87_9BURK|nr:hypothetical protein [Schlegelella koreensis]NUZ04726.1 hypothetical protein [Schlegelella koreensis]